MSGLEDEWIRGWGENFGGGYWLSDFFGDKLCCFCKLQNIFRKKWIT